MNGVDMLKMNPGNSLHADRIAPKNKGASPPDDDALRRNLQGVLLVRLLLGIFFLVLTLLVQSHRAEDLLSGQLRPLYYFSVIVFLFTIVAALAMQRVRNLRRFAYLQIVFDVEAVTFLVYLSGGVESLFSFLYMPAIISGAVLLHRRGSMVSATASALSYGLLLDLQYFGWIAPLKMMGLPSQTHDIGDYFHSILMNIAGFYLTSFLSGYLAEQLRKSSSEVRERKRELHELEVLHRNITQSISSGLLIISPNGQVLFSNHAAQEILALSAEDIDEAPLKRIFPTLDILAWPDATSPTSVGAPEVLARREFVYTRPAGEELCLGYSVSFLKKDTGATAGWVFVFQDLTGVKSMEEHLQRMKRMAFAGRLASEIAHEIRNPLAAISGAAQMLQSEILDGSFHQKLMTIVGREVQRIDDLITDFLWLAKGSQRSEKVEEVSLCALIEEVFALLKASNKITDGHRLEKIFESMPVFIMDPRNVRQILWHLMVNAVEAMPDGGVLTVRVTSPQASPELQTNTLVEIADTGSGVPKEDRERVFEPFFSTKKSGTGLGLSIVYQIMEGLGGRVQLKNNSESGTSVTLFFPF